MVPKKTPHLGWAPAGSSTVVVLCTPPLATAGTVDAVVDEEASAAGSLGRTWNGLKSEAQTLSCSCLVAPTYGGTSPAGIPIPGPANTPAAGGAPPPPAPGKSHGKDGDDDDAGSGSTPGKRRPPASAVATGSGSHFPSSPPPRCHVAAGDDPSGAGADEDDDVGTSIDAVSGAAVVVASGRPADVCFTPWVKKKMKKQSAVAAAKARRRSSIGGYLYLMSSWPAPAVHE